MKREIRYIKAGDRRLKLIILKPSFMNGKVPGILWIHGGGYFLGMAAMVYASCGRMLAEKFGGVVVSPAYRLAGKAPYPAALKDCVTALKFMDKNRDKLGIDRIVVGGESAGGGLAAAVCLFNRDHHIADIDLQLPLYPMLDCDDTPTSADNHGRVWNTKRNHLGWKKYMGDLYGSGNVPCYASPAKAEDLSGLPQCCTYVCDGEPFYYETTEYVRRLKSAGVEAEVDVFSGSVHAFDLLLPWTDNAKKAKKRLCEVYGTWLDNGTITN